MNRGHKLFTELPLRPSYNPSQKVGREEFPKTGEFRDPKRKVRGDLRRPIRGRIVVETRSCTRVYSWRTGCGS